MKFLSFCAGLALLAATPSSANAQSYCPFRPGNTYHFAQNDTSRTLIHIFRVDSVGTAGADSVFFFNRNSHYGPTHAFVRQTVFGASFRWQAATGKATFIGDGGTDTVRIQTRGPVGQQWNFTHTVQATLQSRQVMPVLGQPDTVLTIALSDGKQLQCSRRYGIVSGPALFAYLGSFYLMSHTGFDTQVCGLPERGMGAIDLRMRSLYNQHSGDSLFYTQRDASPTAGPNPTCISSTNMVAITSTAFSSTGDSLVLNSHALSLSQPCAGGPSTSGSHFNAATIPLMPVLLTGEEDPYGFGVTVVTPGVLDPNSFGGRAYISISQSGGMGLGIMATFAMGLGRVVYESGYGANQPTYRERLVGYVKGTERWGTTTRIQPLGVSSALADRLPATLAPNPATDATPAATLYLTLDQPQTTNLAVLDGLGRTVWQQAKALPAGEQAVTIPTASLPAGLYHLRLALADGRQRLLPLVRE